MYFALFMFLAFAVMVVLYIKAPKRDLPKGPAPVRMGQIPYTPPYTVRKFSQPRPTRVKPQKPAAIRKATAEDDGPDYDSDVVVAASMVTALSAVEWDTSDCQTCSTGDQSC